jgi:sarcosine oxidase subunit alpha
MASIDCEGRLVGIEDGDSIASAMYRAGIRIFSRSSKYHRPRGLYCGTGDCPNCLVTVDGEPAVRSCITPARPGQKIARANGWPSVDRDALSLLGLFKWAMPVGFYYKVFTRPKGLWPFVERLIVRLAGLGPIDKSQKPASLERRNLHADLAVIGAGISGLTAALAANERGESVVLVDEGTVGQAIAPGPTRDAIDRLLAAVRACPRITLLERAPASGIFDGPLVTAASHDTLHLIHPKRVIVATGASERHAVFPGSDLPGVWLGRGAARLAGIHHVKPGNMAVAVCDTAESFEHLETIRGAAVDIRAVVVSSGLASHVPDGLRAIVGDVVRANGSSHITSVVVEGPAGQETIDCDTLVLSIGLTPRSGLLRQASPAIATGVGDVVGHELPPSPRGGIVCLCEDADVGDLECAYREGFTSTEILKRYTTITMGPCQGQMCQPHMQAFVKTKDANAGWTSSVTTARPPARAITLEQAAAGFDHHIELRTALHQRHLSVGAQMQWAGAWKRPGDYGDVTKEYLAVRQAVSVMDVGTLGKFRICGPDATEFLDRLYPTRIAGLAIGRAKYTITLNEAGYIFDDGMAGRVGENEYFVTTTTSGADSAEGWFRDWNDTWKLRVRIVNVTHVLGAINVAGPKSRELLARLTSGAIDNAALPYGGITRLDVCGIPCTAIRVGFTGELGFELHHAASRSVELWDALVEAGRDLSLVPHGLEALKLLRLEKGHIIVSQDTDFDTSPAKVGLNWAVRMDKPFFVGRTSLERLASIPLIKRLVPIRFDGVSAPDEGAQLMLNGERIGYLTSSRYSHVLGYGVALGWVNLDAAGSLPATVEAVSDNGRRRGTGTIAHGAFYDREGARLRA